MSYTGNYTDIPDWFPSDDLTAEPSQDEMKEWDVGYKPPAQWRNWQDKGWFIALKNIDQALADHEASKSGIHNVGSEYIAKTSNPNQYPRKQEIVDLPHDNTYHTRDFATESEAQSKVDTHENKTNDVHGVGSSDVESVAGAQSKVDNHSNSNSGVHGVGSSVVENKADAEQRVVDHSNSASGVHGVGSGTIASQEWVNNNADVPNADHADEADNAIRINGSKLTVSQTEPSNPDEGDLWAYC